MKQLTLLLTKLVILAVLLLSTLAQANSEQDKKILMVLSGYGQQQGEERPGYEFDEFAKAYLVFKNNRIEVDIASPQGGPILADKYNPETEYNALVLDDATAMSKLENTLAISKINSADYQGIFVVGGKGAMFDLPKDSSLQQLIADVYQQQGTIAAVCHGPAALVDVKLQDGSYLVANKAVNGFTNLEEQLFGKKWINHFEFMLEDKLVERGGQFQSSDIMLNHVAIDGKLITGQNPSSTVAVANELVRSLGMTPKPMPTYEDDRTLALVAKVLQDDPSAAKSLSANPDKYQLPLAGMYGFYYLKVAETEQQLTHALTLMTLAKEAINNPRLDMEIAKTQQKLGHKKQAAETLTQLIAAKPDFQPAIDMLESLSI